MPLRLPSLRDLRRPDLRRFRLARPGFRRTLQVTSLTIAGIVLATTGWVACSTTPSEALTAHRFTVDGESTHGTPGVGGAPELRAGRFTDVAPQADETTHYIVRRSLRSSTVFVGVTARPHASSRDDRLVVHLWTVAGTSCGTASSEDYDTGRQNSLVTVGVGTAGASADGAGPSAEDEKACRDATQLHVIVEPDYGASTLAGAPDEIVVIEEPAVSTTAGLPPSVQGSASWGSPMPIEERARIDGGSSFPTAPAVRPGSYRSSIVPGEVRLIRTRVRWGQRLRAVVRVPTPSQALARKLDPDQIMDVRLIAPTRADAGVADAELPGPYSTAVHRKGETRLDQMSYDVRYRNRDAGSSLIAGASIAGDYYIAISLASDAQLSDYSVPFYLDVAVDDTTDGGEPAYASDTRIAGPVEENPIALPGKSFNVRDLVAPAFLVVGLGLLLSGGLALLVYRANRGRAHISIA